MNSNQRVMVSIIVPTYNHEKYIAHTLESLLKQETEYQYEILIGDDASTDNTVGIIEEYKRKYPQNIRTFYHRVNVGATKNGYTLLKHAKGAYLAFCDGDDYWTDRERLQRDVDFLQKHLDYAGISNRVCPVNEEGEPLAEATILATKQFWNFNKSSFTLKDFENWDMPGHISALTVRNFMLDKEHDYRIFYRAHPMVGDRTMVLFTALQGSIFCKEDMVSCYRFRLNGKENFMSDFETRNLYAKDYLMIRRLENYSSKEFGISLKADGVKKDRLAAAVVRAMKSKRGSDIKVVMEILRYSGAPMRYLFYIFKIVLLKNIYWHVYKEDRRIRL